MQKTTLLLLFKHFDKQELDFFAKFLQSPIYNTDAKVVQLFDIIAKAYPAFRAADLERKVVFRQIFGAIEYEEQTMYLLISKLKKMVEEFWIWQAFQQKKAYKNQWLLEAYDKRQLLKPFEQQLKKAYKQLNKINVQSEGIDAYYHRFLFDEISFQRRIMVESRPVNTSLPSLLEQLDSYYLAKKLSYFCPM